MNDTAICLKIVLNNIQERNQVIDWCSKNISKFLYSGMGAWSCVYYRGSDWVLEEMPTLQAGDRFKYKIVFENHQDAVLFKLRSTWQTTE